MFNCKNCNKEFNVKYNVGKKVIYFCSKTCATKFQRTSLSKEELENKISQAIKIKGTYLSRAEIIIICKISNKTITKNGISITKLNEALGFKKPKSKFEEAVYNELKEIFKDFNIIREQSFLNLKSPKGFHLYFDFFIPEINLLIEADGNQHYNKNNPNYSEYVNDCDELKNQYCLQNNIDLVRIRYNRTVSKEHIIRAFSTLSIKQLVDYSKNLKDGKISSEAS